MIVFQCSNGNHLKIENIASVVFVRLGDLDKCDGTMFCSLIQCISFIIFYFMVTFYLVVSPAPNAAKRYEHQSAFDSFFPTKSQIEYDPFFQYEYNRAGVKFRFVSVSASSAQF